MTETINSNAPVTKAEPGDLFGAVAGLALHLAGDLVLTANDETESEVDLAIRLLGEIERRAEAVVAERDALKRSVAAQKGQVTKARAALDAQRPAKPRKFEPIAKPLPAGELLDLIGAAETVELAFVDGEREIRGLAPRTIEGGVSAWQATSRGRLRLNVPSLEILGPGPDKSAWRLGGYALLLDGEHIASIERDPVLIAPGTRHEFKDDVIFG